MGSQGSKGYLKKCYFSFILHGMVMWLMMVHQLDPLYTKYGSKNSPGVIWVYWGQKVIFTKNSISPTDDMPWSYDSCILISYIPYTKVIGLAIQSGSFGVTGVKRSFLPKMLFLPQITCHSHVTNVYWSAIYPLQSYGSRNSAMVIWGYWGQKVIFTKNAISPYRLYAMVMWLKYIDQLYTLAIYLLQKLLV